MISYKTLTFTFNFLGTLYWGSHLWGYFTQQKSLRYVFHLYYRIHPFEITALTFSNDGNCSKPILVKLIVNLKITFNDINVFYFYPTHGFRETDLS